MKNPFAAAWSFLRKQWSVQDLEGFGLYIENGRTSNSGKYVDERTAIQAVAVYACVTFLSDIMAMVPRKLYQKTGDKRREAKEHRLYDLLKNRPNPYMSGFSFWQTMTLNFVVYGRAFARKQIENGRLIALWPIPSSQMNIDASSIVPTFKHHKPDGTTKVYGPDEIFYLRGFSIDGYTSISPIDACRQAIGLALTTDEFVARFFSNGAWPGLILEYPNNLSDEKVDRIRESFEGQHRGAARAHRVGFAEGGVKVHKIDVEAQKAQLLESRNFSIEEIARIWRIPPHVIQHLLRSTNNNIEHQGIEVVKYTIAPRATCYEGAIDNQLLTVEERMNGYYSKHSLNALERGDFASRTQGYASMIGSGQMTINEGRALEDMDPVEGGDINRVQMQNVPITAPPPPRPQPTQ